jgi:hypothetical protein
MYLQMEVLSMYEYQVFRNWYYLYVLPQDRWHNFRRLEELFKPKIPGSFHKSGSVDVVRWLGHAHEHEHNYKWRY